jgi:hypothetical protein
VASARFFAASTFNFITIAPWTAQGIFHQRDFVAISNVLGTTVEVHDFRGNWIS